MYSCLDCYSQAIDNSDPGSLVFVSVVGVFAIIGIAIGLFREHKRTIEKERCTNFESELIV